MRKWVTTSLLLVILLLLGGYALFKLTDIGKDVRGFLTKPPTLKTVEEFFPSDEIIPLGKMTTTYTKGKQYVYIINRSGHREMLLLPRSFNSQDINKRTYISISSGEHIPEEETDYMRLSLKEYFEKQEKYVRTFYKHTLTHYKEGVPDEKLVDFYKMEFYDSNEVWFYFDEENNVQFKGSEEDLKLLETF